MIDGQLRDDPDNAVLGGLRKELTDAIKLLDENIAELQPKQSSNPTSEEKPTSPARTDKWSRHNNASYKKNSDSEEKPEAPVRYNVNDNVMARWLSGDKSFYPARITSTTGSSTDPIYIVKFKSYDNTETLRSQDIRPMSNKRKADGAPATANNAASSESSAPGVVKSAGATHYPEAKREADADADGAKAPKPKKIKAKKELEAGKNKWQEFNNKSKFGKKGKKDSMFRTPEGIHGRGMSDPWSSTQLGPTLTAV